MQFGAIRPAALMHDSTAFIALRGAQIASRNLSCRVSKSFGQGEKPCNSWLWQICVPVSDAGTPALDAASGVNSAHPLGSGGG